VIFTRTANRRNVISTCFFISYNGQTHIGTWFLLSPAIGNKIESGAFLSTTQCPVCCKNKCIWRQRLWPHTLCTDGKFRNPVYFLFRELGGCSSYGTTRLPREVNALLYTCVLPHPLHLLLLAKCKLSRVYDLWATDLSGVDKPFILGMQTQKASLTEK
jgi:hypothetical protein